MEMKFADRFIAVVLMLFCIFYFSMTSKIAASAKMWPRFFILFLFLLSIILLISSYRKDVKIYSKKNTEKIILPRLIGAILISIFYIFSILFLGFYSATFIYLIIIMYFLGIINVKNVLVISILSTTIIYICFNLILNVPTPKGMLF